MATNVNVLDFDQLVSATQVYREKASGFVAHTGLLLKFEFSSDLVLHTTPTNNAHLSTLEEFSESKKLAVKGSYCNSSGVLIQRIKEIINRRNSYSIFNNCEHLVSEVISGVPKSSQLSKTLGYGAVGVLATACLSKNSSFTKSVLVFAAVGLLTLQLEKSKQLA